MFCPNCGTTNPADHTYCRSCGLKLEAISRNVAEQFPSAEYAALQRRKELFEKLGLGSLAITGAIAFGMLIWKVGAYKAALFGPEAILWSAFAAFAVFGLLAVFFFNYPGMFMNFDKVNPRLPTADEPLDTNKLIEDRPFEPASVTEHTTELLSQKK